MPRPARLQIAVLTTSSATPPYFQSGAHVTAADGGRAVGRGGAVDLPAWMRTAARRLKPKGHLTLIHRMERLPEVLLAVIQAGFGSLRVLPLSPRMGRAATLFLLEARKGGRAPFDLQPSFALHTHAQHTDGPKDYHPQIEAALRDAAPFVWP